MNKQELYPENISTILAKNINDEKSVFVFPTDTVMNSWADWIVTHPEESGTDAIAFEHFMPWDKFKKEFVSAEKENESVIPAILRKMFITDLIAKNASRPKEERLQVIINPNEKFVKEADSFGEWLSRNLQSLNFWKKRLDANIKDYGELDDEDKDYLAVYNAYSRFLSANNLFEPAWIDDIKFKENKRVFHIFYPEILEDFLDYTDIFEKTDNIYIYTLPEDIENPRAYFYHDSRSELRQTMLQIINIVQSNNADWSEIALSVPKLDIYRPYIQREFDLYEIPYVIKAGVSLTRNSAGRIFREIYDCYNSKFTFESVRALLLDECVPWKEDVLKIKEDLIREGNRMRCICSIDKDIWFSALRKKQNSLEVYIKKLEYIHDKNEEINKKIEKAYKDLQFYRDLKDFYKKLHNSVLAFFPNERELNTFANIRTSWMTFKANFLKKDSDFSEDANNILSRCVKELSEIIEIEEKFKDCNLLIPSPYSFFLQELDNKTYTKQTRATGVNIFPYKLSAGAYFKYQFVIDSSQKNLDISYKRLTYLNNEKREKLKIAEDDKTAASEVFIKLYGKNTECTDNTFVHFSAAENTFNGFAIPHSQLNIVNDLNKNNNTESPYHLPDFDKDDYILNEAEFIKSIETLNDDDNSNNTGLKITESQKNSYNNWSYSFTGSAKTEGSNKINKKIKDAINNTLITKRNSKSGNSNFNITARSDLELFFPCPRKWLFKTILHLKEDSLDTNLMSPFDMGNLNHKIMEKFMNKYKNRALPYFDEKEDIFKIKNNIPGFIEVEGTDYTAEIIDILYGENNIVNQAINEPSGFRDSPLAMSTLHSQHNKIADNILAFLKILLLPYGEGAIDKNGNKKNINGIGNCTVIGFEEELWAERKNFNYFGFVDCYLLSPENEWIIIDYKNSKGSLPDKNSIFTDNFDLLKDFQMPVYYNLVKEGNKHEIGAGYFYAIKHGYKLMATDKFYREIEISKENTGADLDLSQTMKTLDTYSGIFMEKISKNDFTPSKSTDKTDKTNVKNYENCISCPFKTICRTTYNVAGNIIPNKKEGE